MKRTALFTTFFIIAPLAVAAPVAAQEVGVGAAVTAYTASWSKGYDKDGASQDIGSAGESGAIARLSYAAPYGLRPGAFVSYASVNRTGVNPVSGAEVENSGSGLREGGLTLSRATYIGGGLGVTVMAGGKFDLGKKMADLADDEVSVSNNQHAAFGSLEARYTLLEGLRLGALVRGLHNVKSSGTPSLQSGLLLEGGFSAAYTVELDAIAIVAGLMVKYTQSGPIKVDGSAIDDSDANLLHVLPSVTLSSEYGEASVAVGAPLEDFVVGFPLSGKNAPQPVPVSVSLGSSF